MRLLIPKISDDCFYTVGTSCISASIRRFFTHYRKRTMISDSGFREKILFVEKTRQLLRGSGPVILRHVQRHILRDRQPSAAALLYAGLAMGAKEWK